MTKAEVMKVMCDGFINGEFSYIECKLDDYIIHLNMADIVLNLECNRYELNMDFIQDFMSEEGNMIQGHSLDELEVL